MDQHYHLWQGLCCNCRHAQLLALAAKILTRRLAGLHKIAHRLMRLIRRPHGRQLAGSMQPRLRDRVAPVRLDPLARPLRDQRRRDHHAIMTKRLDLTIKPRIPSARLRSRHPAARIGPPIS
jgi:hypothetical protein